MDKKLQAWFYKNPGTGAEPVKEWLRGLPPDERKRIGEDIKTVEYGWPVGMPVCRPLGNGLFEVRTNLHNRISRVLFCMTDDKIILLHGFIKKTQETPKADERLARQRKKEIVGD